MTDQQQPKAKIINSLLEALNFTKLQTLLLKEFNIDPNEAHAQASLSSLGLDSLDRAELEIAIEDHFEIFLEDDLFERDYTLSQLSAIITNGGRNVPAN